MILLSNSKHKLGTAEKYIAEISKADDLPEEDIAKNRERNGDLYVEHPWTCEQLFLFHTNKLNCPNIVTRTGFSIDRGLKKNKLYVEHFKECTFKPTITKKAHEVEQKKTSMIKINESLDVFDADKHNLESPLQGQLYIKNGSSHASNSKNGSKKRRSRAKQTSSRPIKFGAPYSKFYH